MNTPSPAHGQPTIDTPEYRRLRREYKSACEKYDQTHTEADFLTVFQLNRQIGAIEDAYQRAQIAAYVASKRGS